MPGDLGAFFGVAVGTPVVRRGADERLPQHTLFRVYQEMLLQICRDYPGLPDPRTLTMAEIRFFYDGLRAELKRYSKPK